MANFKVSTKTETIATKVVTITDVKEDRTILCIPCPSCGKALCFCTGCVPWGHSARHCRGCKNTFALEWVEEAPAYPDGYYKNSGDNFYYKREDGKWALVNRAARVKTELKFSYQPPLDGWMMPVSWLEVHKSTVEKSIVSFENDIWNLKKMLNAEYKSDSDFVAGVKDFQLMLRDMVESLLTEKL